VINAPQEHPRTILCRLKLETDVWKFLDDISGVDAFPRSIGNVIFWFERFVSVQYFIIIFYVGGCAGFQPSFRWGKCKKKIKSVLRALKILHTRHHSIDSPSWFTLFFATICTSSVVASPRFPDFRTTMLRGRLFCLSLSSSSRVAIVLPHANRGMRYYYYYHNHHYCYHRHYIILLLSRLLL